MVAAEIVAGIGGLKSAFDIAKALKDMDNAASRNAAVIELQEKILGAQTAQTALVEQIRNLEAKVASFEKWEAETKRYQLKDFGGNTFAYELKPDAANGQPTHRICPNCYEQSQKSILQFDFRAATGQDKYDCPSCKTQFSFGNRVERSSRPVRGSDYF